jgi:hypothetical protein
MKARDAKGDCIRCGKWVTLSQARTLTFVVGGLQLALGFCRRCARMPDTREKGQALARKLVRHMLPPPERN